MNAQGCPACLRIQNVSFGTEGRWHDRMIVNCGCCGAFTLSRTADAVLRRQELEPHQRASLMHRIRRASERSDTMIDSNALQLWLDDLKPLSATDQIANLVLWLADHLRYPGERVDLTFDRYQAIVGAANADAFTWVLGHARDEGLIQGAAANQLGIPSRLVQATLTLKGWQAAEEWRRARTASQVAFAAMKFGDPQTDTLFREVLQPAVKLTGFQLRRLDNDQPAGLIDDQLRVAIRQSRFLLAELTHGNRGAYWEAGFAEGLGRPVIYLCRKDVFDSKEAGERPHFDTSHLVTVVWDPADSAGTATRLKAHIRASLPGEAIMSDDATR